MKSDHKSLSEFLSGVSWAVGVFLDKVGKIMRTTTPVALPEITAASSRTGAYHKTAREAVNRQQTSNCPKLCASAPATDRRRKEGSFDIKAFCFGRSKNKVITKAKSPPVADINPAVTPRVRKTKPDFSSVRNSPSREVKISRDSKTATLARPTRTPGGRKGENRLSSKVSVSVTAASRPIMAR